MIFSAEGQNGDLELLERSVRAHIPGRVNFYSSYIYGDNEQIAEGKAYLDSLAETFRRGYKKVKLDVVVVASGDALSFATQYRDATFPGVPIVFYGLNKDDLAAVKLKPGMFGRTESLSVPGTIDLALHLHPDAQAIAVIHDSYGYWWSLAHSELVQRRNRVKEIDIFGPPSADEIREIQALPPHTIALFQIPPESSVERSIGAYDVLNETVKRVPTYSVFHTLCLNYGCIGGVYPDWNQNIVWAGEEAARILAGEERDGPPVVEDSDTRAMVDARQLVRWGIPESALPAGSLVLYREPSVWQRYRDYALAAIFVIAAQALLIAALLWQRARKRKAEGILRESEERFRLLATTSPALIWMCDADGKTTYLNERRLLYTGPDRDAGYGDAWMDYVHPDDLPVVKNAFFTALKNQQTYSKEYRLRRSDGAYRWVFNIASPRLNHDNSFAGFIGSIVDITDQKLARETLQKLSGRLIETQEKERTRIARELHDDICQRLAILSLELGQTNRNLEEPSEKIEEIRIECYEIARDVQALSHRLHSSKLDHLGIVAALRSLCEEFARKFEVTVDFVHCDVPASVPQDGSLCLFRIAQEALRNAVKYSQTERFRVEVRGTAHEVRLEIRDWGTGFDVETARPKLGLGLVSMQERVHLVNGSFLLETSPGNGTRIVAAVPLHESTGTSPDSEATPEAETEMRMR